MSLFVLPMYYQRIAENGGIEAIKRQTGLALPFAIRMEARRVETSWLHIRQTGPQGIAHCELTKDIMMGHKRGDYRGATL